MRNRLLCAMVFAVGSSGLAIADAAYVIKLKNGNEYVTSRYWQEGGQVLFDTYDGVFGIERSFVAKIEKTNRIIRLANAAVGEPTEKPQSGAGKLDIESKEAKQTEESKAEKKREPDDPIVSEFNRLREKSKEVAGMLTGEMRDLLNQITAFKNKITRDSKLFIEYSREFNDLNEIGEIVETALRSRTQ